MTHEIAESTRRSMLAASGASAAAVALTACGSGASDGSSSGSTGAAGASGSAAAGGTRVAKADVPVGGGTILADAKVVVTQPSAGDYKAFSAVCTHQGCIVSSVASTIDCACHNSVFSISDGSVVSGPATSALPAKTVTTNGDNLTIS